MRLLHLNVSLMIDIVREVLVCLPLNKLVLFNPSLKRIWKRLYFPSQNKRAMAMMSLAVASFKASSTIICDGWYAGIYIMMCWIFFNLLSSWNKLDLPWFPKLIIQQLLLITCQLLAVITCTSVSLKCSMIG